MMEVGPARDPPCCCWENIVRDFDDDIQIVRSQFMARFPLKAELSTILDDYKDKGSETK